ncbi:hypothetical protein ACFFX0_25190 [Citricoccus parietis]|uniref:Uncharacterized protein n=1 Tax=Citricoccus parietis TaxID=592307 RepID=A0ABV5G5T7_9MICC
MTDTREASWPSAAASLLGQGSSAGADRRLRHPRSMPALRVPESRSSALALRRDPPPTAVRSFVECLRPRRCPSVSPRGRARRPLRAARTKA